MASSSQLLLVNSENSEIQHDHFESHRLECTVMYGRPTHVVADAKDPRASAIAESLDKKWSPMSVDVFLDLDRSDQPNKVWCILPFSKLQALDHWMSEFSTADRQVAWLSPPPKDIWLVMADVPC